MPDYQLQIPFLLCLLRKECEFSRPGSFYLLARQDLVHHIAFQLKKWRKEYNISSNTELEQQQKLNSFSNECEAIALSTAIEKVHFLNLYARLSLFIMHDFFYLF